MNEILLQLGLVALLVLLNALFAGSELALVSLREGQLQRLERRGRRGAALASLARDPNRYLATIQIGITLAGFLASASAAVALAAPLEAPLSFLGAAARPVAIVLVTMVLSFVTLVAGELAPKRIAMQRAEQWGLLAARPLSWLSRISRPVVWLLALASDLLVRAFGGDPAQQREEVTAEELRDLVATQTAFTPEQRQIIDGAFELSNRQLHDVLCPRPDVLVLDQDASCADGVQRLLEAGLSRAPVAPAGDLDRVTGVVHIRGLFGRAGTVGEWAVEPVVFPATMTVLDAMRAMQARRRHLAVVIGEHGDATGIVTVEDLLEELVGEIYDESDRAVKGVQRLPGGGLVLTGRFAVHDLPRLGITVPDGDYTTVAGLVLSRLGHIPDEAGATVDVGDWSITVLAVAHRAIATVRIDARTSDAAAGLAATTATTSSFENKENHAPVPARR